MTSIGGLLAPPRTRPDPVPVRAAAGLRPAADLLVPATVLAWVVVLLLLDRHASPTAQGLLGAATWLILIALGRREPTEVRLQVAVVVLFATAVEYTFSGWLGVYVYRLGNVPSFVPPGHGLVYLAALALGRSGMFTAHPRPLVAAAVVGGSGYAAWGLLLSPRHDVLGAFWFLCLLGFLRWGRSALLFVGAFVVVTFLELLGTSLGTWTWQPLDPTGHIPIGNPPSGAAGGYGWFDLAAVLVTPTLLHWLKKAGVGGRTLPRRVLRGASERTRRAVAATRRWAHGIQVWRERSAAELSAAGIHGHRATPETFAGGWGASRTAGSTHRH